jgi:integrase
MLQKMTLSSNLHVALMPPGRHRVEGETGLYLYVSPDEQVRRWLFRFTSPATKRVTETGLDMAAAVSLSQAKAKAGDLRKQIAQGVCPIAAKRNAKAEQTTFGEAADQWIETNKPSWKHVDAGSQMTNARVLLKQHGAPLANKRVAEITTDMVETALKPLLSQTPFQARRALGMWERVFDLAKAKGWREGDNPAAWRGNMEYRFPRQRKTDRGHYAALPYEQMPEFMKALRLRQERATGAVALEFLILTCARTGEVLGMRWDEIDWDKKLWALSAERTKQGRAHTVPLSERAMAILEQQKQYRNGSEFVFTGYRQTQMDNKSLAAQLRSMKIDTTVHGFRSTFRDYMGNETNFAREPVEHCLAHRLGNSVEQAYRRQDALNKRRVILSHWAEYCAGGAQ